VSCGGTVLTTDPADWDAVFRTNVGGTWLWARAAIPEMQRRGGGSIITFASQLAVAGGRNNSAYIAAKGAIISLTRTMAVDFASDRIRVNAIAPGLSTHRCCGGVLPVMPIPIRSGKSPAIAMR
jgi:NAD(P)-dependent dehydrogenase (short-subunit alcohol dehydrogenase family)